MEKNLCITRFNKIYRWIYLLILSLAPIFLMVNPLWAQEIQNGKDSKFWFDAGFGLSTAGAGPATESGGGLAGRLALHVQVHRIVMSLPITVNTGGKSNYKVFGFTMKDEYYYAGLLAGYAIGTSDKLDLVLSTGISNVWGSQIYSSDADCSWFCSGGKRESFDPVWGVPLELGFYSSGNSPFGISVVSYINFNPEEVFGGLTINLMFGDRHHAE